MQFLIKCFWEIKMVDIKGLDKAVVLVALFNGSRQQGMGFLDDRGSKNLTLEKARELISFGCYFDYLYGRVMKIDLSKDKLDPWLYDRDNGDGAAQEIINKLRNNKTNEE